MTTQTMTVEALDIEVGDVILGVAEGQRWMHRPTVVRVTVDRDRRSDRPHVEMMIESKANGRQVVRVYGYTDYEVRR